MFSYLLYTVGWYMLPVERNRKYHISRYISKRNGKPSTLLIIVNHIGRDNYSIGYCDEFS